MRGDLNMKMMRNMKMRRLRNMCKETMMDKKELKNGRKSWQKTSVTSTLKK